MPQNVLTSYAFMRNDKQWESLLPALQGSGVDVMMDSGAFSAYSIGTEIALGEYIDHCKRLAPYLWQYVALDVVVNRERTSENLSRMVDAGLTPMPVLTFDEDESAVVELVKINPRICMAGGGKSEKVFYSARIERVFRESGEQALIHGLAYTRGLEVLTSRVASIDSSSWMVNARYGHFMTFDRRWGFRMVHKIANVLKGKGGFAKLPPYVRDYFVRNGIGIDVFMSKEGRTGVMSILALSGVHAWTQYARVCAANGVRMFFAVPNSSWLVPLALMANHDQGDTFDWKELKRDVAPVKALLKENPEAFVGYWKKGLARELWTRSSSYV